MEGFRDISERGVQGFECVYVGAGGYNKQTEMVRVDREGGK